MTALLTVTATRLKDPRSSQNKRLPKILYPKVFFQLAKGDEFSRCQYVTPDGRRRTFISVKNGQEVVDEDNNIIDGVVALLEIDNLPVCGLKLTNFTLNYFGWWSCEMGNNNPKSIFHKGTFKINEPNEWLTEIRLPTDVKVNRKSSISTYLYQIHQMVSRIFCNYESTNFSRN